MSSENQLELEIALRKIHELALAEGDLGHEYWQQSASFFEIDALSKELERCRAKCRTKN